MVNQPLLNYGICGILKNLHSICFHLFTDRLYINFFRFLMSSVCFVLEHEKTRRIAALKDKGEKHTQTGKYELLVLFHDQNKKVVDNQRPEYQSGAAGSRTLVQTNPPYAFYMLI